MLLLAIRSMPSFLRSSWFISSWRFKETVKITVEIHEKRHLVVIAHCRLVTRFGYGDWNSRPALANIFPSFSDRLNKLKMKDEESESEIFKLDCDLKINWNHEWSWINLINESFLWLNWQSLKLVSQGYQLVFTYFSSLSSSFLF